MLEEQSILYVSGLGGSLFNCDSLQKRVSKCNFEIVGLKAFRQNLQINRLLGESWTCEVYLNTEAIVPSLILNAASRNHCKNPKLWHSAEKPSAVTPPCSVWCFSLHPSVPHLQ